MASKTSSKRLRTIFWTRFRLLFCRRKLMLTWTAQCLTKLSASPSWFSSLHYTNESYMGKIGLRRRRRLRKFTSATTGPASSKIRQCSNILAWLECSQISKKITKTRSLWHKSLQIWRDAVSVWPLSSIVFSSKNSAKASSCTRVASFQRLSCATRLP